MFKRTFFAVLAMGLAGATQAAIDNLSSSVIVLECRETAPKMLHLSCKTTEAAEVSSDLINYDVKTDYGKILATGTGTDITFDEFQLPHGSNYFINVFALVNGQVESQTIVRTVK